MKKFCCPLKRNVSLVTLSPCQFKLLEKSRGSNSNDIDNLESHASIKRNNMPPNGNLFPNTNVKNWSRHEEFLANLSSEISHNTGEDSTMHEKKFLIRCWLIGQLKGILSLTGRVEVASLVLTRETLFHFELADSKSEDQINGPFPYGGTLDKGNASKEGAADLLYLLIATFDESSHDDLLNSFELELSATDKNGNGFHDLELAIGNVEIGDPVTLESVAESSFYKNFNPTVSSLSWMEKATSDVINRMLFSVYAVSLATHMFFPLYLFFERIKDVLL